MSEMRVIYRYSKEQAVRCNEEELWRESYEENCNCARAIEKAIHRDFDGMHLGETSAKAVIDAYGYDRVMWVLANTLQEKQSDGRFSPENKKWGNSFYIPKDDVRLDYCVGSHPAVLDGFINLTRKSWEELGLFDSAHCYTENDGEMDYTGKVVVIDPRYLKDEYKTPEDQLFLATGGFGCRPHARGRKVFGQFLKDGEQACYYREDIIGVLKEEHLPEWVSDKMQEKNETEQEQSVGIAMQ